MSGVPDCRTCGVCCRGDERWVALRRGDDDRLGAVRTRSLTVLVEQGRGYFTRAMRMDGGRCTAFRNRLEDGLCGCSIHEVRPETCREFESGGEGCLAARRAAGLGDAT